MTEETPRRRRWYQFRLRMLLIAVLVLSLPLSWFAWEVKKMKRQREIGIIIYDAGGTVSYQRAEPSVPQRIREFFGDDSVNVVVTAVVVNEKWVDEIIIHDFLSEEGEEVVNAPPGWDEFGDDEAAYLEELPNLKMLSLSNTHVSDAGLEHLKGLTNLEILYLDNMHVSDAGLEHLKGLTNLGILRLDNTHVSDAGLEHLEGLTSLKVLYLNNTQVTHEGVKKLQDALPNCSNIEY